MSGPIQQGSGERVTVPVHLLSGRAEHYVLRVVGDCMIDEGVQDGDYVIVSKAEPSPGDMAVVLVGEDAASIKRWYPEGPMVRLQPANPCLQSIRVPAADVKTQGVVVGLMRKIETLPPSEPWEEVPDAH